ncbi:hypothetical protein C1645_820048 [Glomus cerebriforme]|uniref:Uncharacterized protein n=1 Tax=Glomus cerebriforme TaxID=658196 RepID=A0A397T974_9GLOM|nr:hypothetical protein C1645_820048 [Glomus cerebriforme]
MIKTKGKREKEVQQKKLEEERKHIEEEERLKEETRERKKKKKSSDEEKQKDQLQLQQMMEAGHIKIEGLSQGETADKQRAVQIEAEQSATVVKDFIEPVKEKVEIKEGLSRVEIAVKGSWKQESELKKVGKILKSRKRKTLKTNEMKKVDKTATKVKPSIKKFESTCESLAKRPVKEKELEKSEEELEETETKSEEDSEEVTKSEHKKQ